MKRSALAVLAAGLVAGVLVAQPAAAAVGPTPPPETPPRPVGWVTIDEPVIPPCVTTVWRARHTHRPKTAPGELCMLLPGMWRPPLWQLVAGGQIGSGPVELILERPILHPQDDLGARPARP